MIDKSLLVEIVRDKCVVSLVRERVSSIPNVNEAKRPPSKARTFEKQKNVWTNEANERKRTNSSTTATLLAATIGLL
jgi:hypothetical protein